MIFVNKKEIKLNFHVLYDFFIMTRGSRAKLLCKKLATTQGGKSFSELDRDLELPEIMI